MEIVYVGENLEDGGCVAAPVHVVGGGEEGEGLPAVVPEEAVLHHLVTSHQQLEAVGQVPRLQHVLAEEVARPPGTRRPARAAVVRVAPREVTQRPRSRQLPDAVLGAEVVNSGREGREAAVAAEEPPVHHGGHGQEVEGVCEGSPHLTVAVLQQTLVVEAEHLSLLSSSKLELYSSNLELYGSTSKKKLGFLNF